MANVIPTQARRTGAKAASPLAAAVSTYNVGDDVDAMIVNNGSASPITVTIATLGQGNSVVTVPATSDEVILFMQGGGGPHVHHTVTLSSTTTVTVGFFKSAA